MSDTLLDYAQPFIDRVPHDHGPEELRKALLIASGVWNAVVQREGTSTALWRLWPGS